MSQFISTSAILEKSYFDVFAYLERNLNKLYLENNKISKLIDSPFKNLLNLKYLSLAHNEIGVSEDAQNAALKAYDWSVVIFQGLLLVDARSLRIQLVTTLTFKGLKKLETLIMSDNNIVKFSPGIFQSCFE